MQLLFLNIRSLGRIQLMKILRCSRSFILSNRPMATRNLPLKRGAVDAITPTLLLSTPVEDSPTKPRAKKRTKTLKPSSQGKGFEDFNRPTEQECIQVTRSLAALHGRKLSEDKPGATIV